MSKKHSFKDYARATAFLCNDYRDSIFYSFIAIVAMGRIYNDGNVIDIIINFFSSAALREVARGFAWYKVWDIRSLLASVSSKDVRFGTGALAVGIAFGIIEQLLDPANHIYHLTHVANPMANSPMIACEMLAMAFGLMAANGVKSIFSAYKKTMWDWPRKNKPPRHKSPIKEKIGEMIRKLAQAAAPPRPALGWASITLRE